MTLSHEYEQPPFPPHAPAQPQYQPPAPKKKFNWKLAAMVFAAVLIGGVVGSALKPAPDPVIQVQEKIVEKEVTPKACLTALNLSEDSRSGITDALRYSLKENFTSATRSIEGVTALAPKLDAAMAECRAK